MRKGIKGILLFGGVLLVLLGGCGRAVQEEALPIVPEEALGERTEITLLAVGDLMVHDVQLTQAFEDGGYNFSAGFAAIAGDLWAADMVVGNLETVFGGEEPGYSGYPRFNTPDSFAYALAEAGFTLVSTANNHCLDQGVEGVLRTLEVLDGAGIAHTGTYRSLQEQQQVCLQSAGGVNVAFLSGTFGVNQPLPSGNGYMVGTLERGAVLEQIQAAKALDPDFIVALPHMGIEYSQIPGQEAEEWAEFLLANGVDIVLATHPHVLQPVQLWQTEDGLGTGLVTYSLGNFISSQLEPPRDLGMLLKLRLVKEGEESWLEEASFIPTWVQYADSQGRRTIRVLSIYDALLDSADENSLLVSERDKLRLRRANAEITGLLLGQPAPELEREYILYRRTAFG